MTASLRQLDDVVVFDTDPSLHVTKLEGTIRAITKVQSHALSTILATDAAFLSHTIFRRRHAERTEVEARTKIPMPTDLKQLRSLLGALFYFRKFLRDMAKRRRPIAPLLKQGAKVVFIPAMRAIVRKLLAELITPPILVYPNRDAITDNSRPFLLYCDANVDGSGASLEQNQEDHTILLIVFSSRSTIEPERHWTPLDLETGGIVWSIKRLRSYLWGTKFRFFRTTWHSEVSTKSQNTTRGYSGGWSSSPRTTTLWNIAKPVPTGMPKSSPAYPCLQLKDGPSSLTLSDEEYVALIRSYGLLLRGPSTVRVGLGGLAPSDASSGLGELPLSLHDFCDFRRNGPRKRVDDLGAPSGEFVARAPL